MRVCIALLLWLLFASQLGAESLRIVTEDIPSYNFQVGNEVRGLSSGVVQAVRKQINWQAEIEFPPWARTCEIARYEKNFLFFSIVQIPEREALSYWVSSIDPYRISPYKLKTNTLIRVIS